ncbi:MAG: GtrA family protein [Lachnospiraceae bacterium]|nr:GtrA family protein [Lachnospiraceae bacterium]
MNREEKKAKLMKQILKFGVVGGLSFLIDYVVYAIVLKLINADYDYMIAGIAGFSVSLVFNYLASMKFVFESKDGMDKRKEFIIFMVLSLIGMGINALILWLWIDVLYKGVAFMARLNDGLFDLLEDLGLHVAGSAAELAALIAKLVATAIVMVYNFISRKMVLEKKE